MAPPAAPLCAGLLAHLAVAALGLRSSPPAVPPKRPLRAEDGDAEQNGYGYASISGVRLAGEWPPEPLAQLPPLRPPSSSASLSVLPPEGAAECPAPPPRTKTVQPWSQQLPGAKAAQEAVGSAAGGGRTCGHLGAPVEQQYDAVLRPAAHELWVWTVANSAYGSILADWQLQMRRMGAQRVLIVSVDKEPKWAASLCSLGFAVVDATEAGRRLASVKEAKFKTPAHFLRSKVANVFLELDIFWRRETPYRLPDLWNSTEGADIALAGQLVGSHESINIGFWMSPGTASPHLAEVFELALAGKRWDQVCFNNVVTQCCTVLKVVPKIPKSTRRALQCSESMRGVTVASFMHETVVLNGCYESPSPQQEAQRRGGAPKAAFGAVHIWSRSGPTKRGGGIGKVAVAKNAGLFEGAGCYYEQCDSGERYVAWDGTLPDSPEARVAMQLLVTLGLAMNRTVILPRVKAANGTTFGEKRFDATQVQLGRPPRESSFLYHAFLPKSAMYPVARLAVHDVKRSSVQVARGARDSSATHYGLAAGAAASAAGRSLLALSALPAVAASKLALLSVPFGAGLLGASGLAEGGCRALDAYVEKKLRQCEPRIDPAGRWGDPAVMQAHEVCGA